MNGCGFAHGRGVRNGFVHGRDFGCALDGSIRVGCGGLGYFVRVGDIAHALGCDDPDFVRVGFGGADKVYLGNRA